MYELAHVRCRPAAAPPCLRTLTELLDPGIDLLVGAWPNEKIQPDGRPDPVRLRRHGSPSAASAGPDAARAGFRGASCCPPSGYRRPGPFPAGARCAERARLRLLQRAPPRSRALFQPGTGFQQVTAGADLRLAAEVDSEETESNPSLAEADADRHSRRPAQRHARRRHRTTPAPQTTLRDAAAS